MKTFKFETGIETMNDGGSYMGYTKCMESLKNKNMNVLSLSAIPKKFIHQSIRGGKVSVANGTQQLINGKITGLDVNSLYPYALSLIDAPLGIPRLITDKMTLSDVMKKPIYYVRAYLSKYHRQHELDVPLTEGYHVFNNIDLQYLPIEIDETKPITGYYWEPVQPLAFKELVDELYKRKIAGNANAKGIMNKMIGMFGKTPRKTFTRIINSGKATERIRDHPLIKTITERNNKQYYEYYTSLDYMYNYIHVYSLVLSKAKQIMEELFREYHKNKIDMFCTSTDSLYIKTADLNKLEHHIDNKQLGKLKIETQGNRGCFAGYRLYAIDNITIVLPNQ